MIQDLLLNHRIKCETCRYFDTDQAACHYCQDYNNWEAK